MSIGYLAFEQVRDVKGIKQIIKVAFAVDGRTVVTEFVKPDFVTEVSFATNEDGIPMSRIVSLISSAIDQYDVRTMYALQVLPRSMTSALKSHDVTIVDMRSYLASKVVTYRSSTFDNVFNYMFRLPLPARCEELTLAVKHVVDRLSTVATYYMEGLYCQPNRCTARLEKGIRCTNRVVRYGKCARCNIIIS
jgi:hypothetical protein